MSSSRVAPQTVQVFVWLPFASSVGSTVTTGVPHLCLHFSLPFEGPSSGPQAANERTSAEDKRIANTFSMNVLLAYLPEKEFIEPTKARLMASLLSLYEGGRIPGVSSNSNLFDTLIHCCDFECPGVFATDAALLLAILLIKVDLPTLGIPTIIALIG